MTRPPLDKAAVIQAIRDALAAELDAVERVAAMARDEAASEETKQEGKYDTRATEASYLARGQAWRVAALRRLRSWFELREEPEDPDVVGIGSLVHLSGHRELWLFVAPSAGPAVEVEGRRVQVVSPSAPLGAALLDLECDDAFDVNSPQGRVEYEVAGLW